MQIIQRKFNVSPCGQIPVLSPFPNLQKWLIQSSKSPERQKKMPFLQWWVSVGNQDLYFSAIELITQSWDTLLSSFEQAPHPHHTVVAETSSHLEGPCQIQDWAGYHWDSPLRAHHSQESIWWRHYLNRWQATLVWIMMPLESSEINVKISIPSPV